MSCVRGGRLPVTLRINRFDRLLGGLLRVKGGHLEKHPGFHVERRECEVASSVPEPFGRIAGRFIPNPVDLLSFRRTPGHGPPAGAGRPSGRGGRFSASGEAPRWVVAEPPPRLQSNRPPRGAVKAMKHSNLVSLDCIHVGAGFEDVSVDQPMLCWLRASALGVVRGSRPGRQRPTACCTTGRALHAGPSRPARSRAGPRPSPAPRCLWRGCRTARRAAGAPPRRRGARRAPRPGRRS